VCDKEVSTLPTPPTDRHRVAQAQRHRSCYVLGVHCSAALGRSVAIAWCLASVGCGESATGTECMCAGPPNSALSYQTAPIIYGLFDPPGTFMTSLSALEPSQVNDIYDFYPIALSPERKQLAQVTLDDTGAPRGAVVVTALQPNGRKLGSFATPGTLLGWNDEQHLLFEDAEGVAIVTATGAETGKIRLPDWAIRDTNGNYATRSPDGAAFAFIVASTLEEGLFLLLLDGTSGDELGKWPVEARGELVWARDGHLVLTTDHGFLTATLGDTDLAGPFDLPFQPCGPSEWTLADHVHLHESVLVGDHGYCGNSWTVRTDGTDLVRRDAPPPIALSPDYERLLVSVNEGAGLAASTAEGVVEEALAGVVNPHDASW